jgi:excisionase family DNA binding protein
MPAFSLAVKWPVVYFVTMQLQDKPLTPLTVSPEEAAIMLGCCAEQVRRKVRAGELPRVQGIGRRVRISREAVHRAIAGEKVGAR